MRIRHKPWAKPELEACPFYISEPKLNRGHWNTIFPGEKKPLRLGIGLRKGRLYLAGSSRQSGLSLHRNGHQK